MTTYERVTFREEGKRARTIYLQDPTVGRGSALGEFLTGVEVNREGDEIYGPKFDDRRHIISTGLIVSRTSMRMDNIYGELVETA